MIFTILTKSQSFLPFNNSVKEISVLNIRHLGEILLFSVMVYVTGTNIRVRNLVPVTVPRELKCNLVPLQFPKS